MDEVSGALAMFLGKNAHWHFAQEAERCSQV